MNVVNVEVMQHPCHQAAHTKDYGAKQAASDSKSLFAKVCAEFVQSLSTCLALVCRVFVKCSSRFDSDVLVQLSFMKGNLGSEGCICGP